MARVTFVKHARQRYEQKPANVDAEGRPVKVGLTQRDGSPKTDKRGSQIFITPTVDDRCDKCGTQIKPGDPYKHISPRSGPYGGRRLNRCDTCPTWQVWEYSSSTSARAAQIQSEAETMLDGVDSAESLADVESIRDDIAQSIREFAEEKGESADSLEEGFGHETSQSAEIREVADNLESWAYDVESVDLPDYPEAEEQDCDNSDFHNEDREVEDDEECPDCGGDVSNPGQVEGDEPDDDQIEEWRTECRDTIQGALDNCPV
jgi:hypothetical protein